MTCEGPQEGLEAPCAAHGVHCPGFLSGLREAALSPAVIACLWRGGTLWRPPLSAGCRGQGCTSVFSTLPRPESCARLTVSRS